MELGWQFVLLGFGVWFTWFFVGNRLWIFLLSFAVYAATLYLWRKVREYLYGRFAGSRTVKYVNRIIFWGLPPLILLVCSANWIIRTWWGRSGCCGRSA